jgi:hypothetical protein
MGMSGLIGIHAHLIRYIFYEETKREKRTEKERKKEHTLTQVYALMKKKRLGVWFCCIGCVGIWYIDLMGWWDSNTWNEL